MSPALRFPRPAWAAPASIAIVAFIAVVVAIDPAGDYPNMPEGPGLTIDEPFNVEQGVWLVEGLRGWLLGAVSLREVFNDPDDAAPKSEAAAKDGSLATARHDGPTALPTGEAFHSYNPDHPPLGRLWLGLWHHGTATVFAPRQHPGIFITACARTGSAAAFAITVFLCGWVAGKSFGSVGGAIAASALVLMPRAFGHAHLAALESCIGLTYLIAVLAVARNWTGEEAPSWKCAAWTGLALGAAMLTKIQGVLIPVPVIVWALYRWRLRAFLPLAVWGIVGLVTLFVLWPWLWPDPVMRFAHYLGRTTQRTILYVWYFGHRYADREVPWHYPAVMFLSTVPLGLQALGFIGVFGGEKPIWKAPEMQALIGSLLFPLVLFSLPRIAVYDGARLFLVVFPLWAIVIGRGGAILWTWLRRRLTQRATVSLTVCALALQVWGLATVWPCFLSYYNLGVGGLRGAERLGLELDYWGEAVTRHLLEQVAETVPEGAHLDVAPVLHPFQLDEMTRQSPILRRRGIVLEPYRQDAARHSDYLLLFRRLADLSPELQRQVKHSTPLKEVRRSGVLLAGLYQTVPTQEQE